MKKILLTSLMLLGLMTGCTQSTSHTPALGGNTQYPGALPSPNDLQNSAAVSASTMMAPVKP